MGAGVHIYLQQEQSSLGLGGQEVGTGFKGLKRPSRERGSPGTRGEQEEGAALKGRLSSGTLSPREVKLPGSVK